MYLSDDVKKTIITTLKVEIPGLQALYLFGSQNDGSAVAKSDIDIAYLATVCLSNVQRWNVSQKMAMVLSKDVDLIELKETNTVFRYQILSTAERIYGEGYDIEKFETLAYSLYLQFQEERQPIVDAIMQRQRVFSSQESKHA